MKSLTINDIYDIFSEVAASEEIVSVINLK